MKIRLATLAIVLAANATAGAQATPKSGTEVLQRMHDAYAGKWYRTLTFVQKTTRYGKDGTDQRLDLVRESASARREYHPAAHRHRRSVRR